MPYYLIKNQALALAYDFPPPTHSPRTVVPRSGQTARLRRQELAGEKSVLFDVLELGPARPG
jgi:hypothetical protein